MSFVYLSDYKQSTTHMKLKTFYFVSLISPKYDYVGTVQKIS